MKLSVILKGLVASATILSSVIAHAASPSIDDSHLSARAADVDTEVILVWPESAGAHRVRRAQGITNAERMQRGLTPSRPRKMYQAKEDDLAKRIVGAPQSAQVSDTPKFYDFVNCFNAASLFGGPGAAVLTITGYTDFQDLANQCAAKQDQVASSRPDALPGFIIRSRTTANCAVSIRQNGASTTCSTDVEQSALYTKRL